MFEIIPLHRPSTPLLDSIQSGTNIRELKQDQLLQLSAEVREFLLYSVGQTGGHFGAGLGVVELTVALHYVFKTPDDRIVWDVGHQTYPHKILTGRTEEMHSIRQMGGLAGFPKRTESPFDTFGVGHSSTSVSAALGMALANKGGDKKCVAVIGDGAMTAGMAFEALNHACHTNADILVVLNDNNMSISPNVGGLSTYFSKIWVSKFYTNLRESGKKVLENHPHTRDFARKTEEYMKAMVSPSTLFEELGFYYVGPIDGHDLDRLTHDLKNLSEIPGPKLLHVITQKGKGFIPAEKDPVGYHALNKIEPKIQDAPSPKTVKRLKYQEVFGRWLCDTANTDSQLVAITPAMSEGSGMTEFSNSFPDRFYDVAIAEQHAVTLAAGLACEKLKPVVAIYSTFLQRAYDQLIHDVAIQNLDVTFAVDRAGLVGEDGPTHSGTFDTAYLRCIPNLILATPSDEKECYLTLSAAFNYCGPAAVRYPRGKGTGAQLPTQNQELECEVGKGRKLRSGSKVCILNFGPLLPRVTRIAETNDYTLCDMRWAKPLDNNLILENLQNCDLVVTIEDGCIAGGAGSGVAEFIATTTFTTSVLHFGVPDTFVEHATRDQQLDSIGMSETDIENQIRQRFDAISPNS